MKVPQFSPWIGKEEYEAIGSCFENNWITEGPKSKEFSQELLKLIGAKYGVFAPNGTLAIYLGLRAMGIGRGDEVIVPDFTFIASATAVEMAGGTPVFVDVNRKNFQIDISEVEKLITKKTKAIMPVHIYGTVCNMDLVMKFAKKHKLMVIEDAAQAIAVHWKGKHAGTFGKVGCFSFFADKTITTAEGGFVVTNDEKIYENLLYLRNQGRINRGSFIHPAMGYNFRMTDLQNAVGLVQLGKIKEIKRRKEHILKLYRKELNGLKEITFFKPEKGAEWIPFRVGIMCSRAHELMSFLCSREIETRTFFYPLHKQPCFSYLKNDKHKNEDCEFPNTFYGYENGVCLPTFPTLTDKQAKYICDTIREYFKTDVFYKYYDAIYKNKDYSGEAKTIFNIANKYNPRKTKKVLEIGCGTGNHTIHLARKNINLTALDVDNRMVEIAKNKFDKLGLKNIKVYGKSVEEIGETGFDLVVALFNVINYLADKPKLESFMQGVAKCLTPGGLFVFDLWNGEAALLHHSKNKKTVVSYNGKKVVCNLFSKTNVARKSTELNYNIVVGSGKGKERGRYSLSQKLWFSKEIEKALKNAGMEILFISPLMQPDKLVTTKDWKIMFCARMA